MTAYKAGDTKSKNALSLVKNELAKAEKEKGEPLTESEEIKVVQKQIKEQQETRQYLAARQTDHVDMSDSMVEEVDRIIAMYKTYLPAQMDEAALTDVIRAIAQDVTADNPGKRIGMVMKKLKEGHEGSYDPKLAGGLVKKLLSE